jgi:hypothetical protein
MTTTTSAFATPILLSAITTPTTGGVNIDLVFDTAMAAGGGTIFITDGAVQTVIDRATGQPTMRVVGATDTHAISAASVSIAGTHVKLAVPGLLPGHDYSIVMGAGVLTSSGHVAFGGVRSTSQLQFSTMPAPDGEGPVLLSSEIDGSLLKSGGSLQVTLTFSDAVSGLTADALGAPNAAVSTLVAVGDGHTWLATLTPAGALEAPANALTIDMSKVHDAAGNAGSGSSDVAAYTVDTKAPACTSIALDSTVLRIGGSVQVTFTFSEAVKDLPASAIQAPGAAIGNLVSSDDGRTWTGTLSAHDPNTSSGNVLSVDMSKLQDLNGNAGNGSFASAASYAIDTVAPTVADIQLNGALVSASDSVDVVIKFSEKVSLSGDAINAPHASLQGLHSDDGLTWTFSLRPDSPLEASGNVLSIDMSKVHDDAGNAGSATAQAAQAYAVDSAGPAASIVLDGAELRYGASIGVTITLSDQVSPADLANALTAQNATVEGLSATADPLVWTATLTPGASAAAGTNAVTLDLSKLHDAHGNAGVGVAASPNYLVDTMATAYVDSAVRIQDGTGASAYDNVTNKADQSIFGTLSDTLKDGEHVHLTITGTATAGIDVTSDTREWDFGGGTYHFADGVYTITAQVVDAAGHGSAAVTQQITIDTVGPKMLTSPDGASGSASDELVFTFDEAVYSIGDEAVPMVFTDAGGGKTEVYLSAGNFSADRKTLTIPASQHHLLTGQNYTITLPSSITDLAGNPIQNLAPMQFHTTGGDTLAPWATAAVAQTAPGLYGIGARIDIAVSFSEAVRLAGSGTPVLHLNNGGLATWDHVSADGRTVFFKYLVGANGENDSTGSASIGLSGTTDLAGHVSDLAGNMLDQAHMTFSALATGGILQVDAHAPSAPAAPVLANDTGVAGDGITSAPVFAGSGAASLATIKLFDNGALIGSTTSNADGNWSIGSFTLSNGTHTLLDGTHTLVARQYDGASNESPASSALTITVDSSAPNKPGKPLLSTASDSGTSNHDGITNDATPTLSGVAAEAGGKVELYEGGTLLGTATAGTGGNWSFTVGSQGGYLAALADGVHSLTVKEVDAAGNGSASSDALAIQVKTLPPAAPAKPVLDAASDSGASSSDGITNDKTPTITGAAAESGATVNVYEGATLLGTTTAGAGGNWSFTVGSQGGYPALLADGVHTLTAKQVDAAGNLSAASAALTITIDTVGPTLVNTALDWMSGKPWFELEFSEKIVFTPSGALDVVDTLGTSRSHHAGDVQTNWVIGNNDLGVKSVLELNLAGLIGLFQLHGDNGAIQDLAGNAAVIGVPSVTIPLIHL